LVEEPHRVDRFDVLVERIAIEGLPLLRLEMDADGILLDADVALDADAAHGRGFDRRSALRERAGGLFSAFLRRDQRHADRHRHRQQPQREMDPAPARHPPPHPTPTRGAGPTAAGSMRPATRRSVRSMAAASRSLWVATISVEPLSSFSWSSTSCTRSPVA